MDLSDRERAYQRAVYEVIEEDGTIQGKEKDCCIWLDIKR